MHESPYTGRGGFQLKIFYIPENQCAYIQRKTKIPKKPIPAIAMHFNDVCNQAAGQPSVNSRSKSPGFRRPRHKRKGSLPEFGRNR